MAFLTLAIQTFESYRTLGEKAMNQVSDVQLFREPGEDANSIGMIVHHLAGNMLSRWTDFLTTDGEKSWRNRDREFEPVLQTREEVNHKWNEGWNCLFNTLNQLSDAELEQIVFIRSEPHTVQQAITRQIAHYAYHVGQIVYLAKIIQGKRWHSLSIPKGQSDTYNRERMG